VVEHPFLSTVAFSVVGNFATKLIDALAKRAHVLLKRAVTRGKRVDMMIPFEHQSWIVVRVIGAPPPNELAGGIASEGEVRQALISATAAFQKACERDPQEPVLIKAELYVRTRPGELQIHTHLASESWPVLQKQIAEAKSEKPISLRMDEPTGGVQRPD